jgi:hypothetical protein
MCSKKEPDRYVRDAQDRPQEEIRRLFERYRAARQRPGGGRVQAPDTLEEPGRR